LDRGGILKIFSDDGARTTSKRLEHGVAPQWEQRLYNGTPGRDHVPPPFSPHASSNQFVGASPFKTFPAALRDGVQHLERPWPGGRIVADGGPGVFVPPPGDDAAPQPQAKPLAGAPASGAPRTVSPTHLDDEIVGLKWLRRTDVTSSSAVGAPAVAKLHPRRARAGFVAEFVAALCLVAARLAQAAQHLRLTMPAAPHNARRAGLLHLVIRSSNVCACN
jgi:hypothetical protein